ARLLASWSWGPPQRRPPSPGRAGSLSRQRLERLHRTPSPDPLASDQSIDEELGGPVERLERAVLRAEREGALHAAPEPGVTARAVLGRLEEAEHWADRLEPLALPGDLEQAQPDIPHLRLTGQAAPRRRRRPASGETPRKAAVWPDRGGDPLCGAGGVADEPRVLQHAPTLEQTADAVGDGM